MARRLLLLLAAWLAVLVAVTGAAAAAAAAAPEPTAPAPAPAPAPASPPFAVHPPPLSRALFPALEAVRLHALRLLGGGRSLYIDTSAGTHVHVLVFEAPRASRRRRQQQQQPQPPECPPLLPPIVLLHGVCSTAHDYAPLVRRLRRRCQRCVYDRHRHLGRIKPPAESNRSIDRPIVQRHSVNLQRHSHTHPTPSNPQPNSVIVLDLPGHGRSPVPPGDPDLETLVTSAVEAVKGALALLEPEEGAGRGAKVVLFGNSLGGLVGCRVALAMPERIAGLCLASPAGAIWVWGLSGKMMVG
jgi:pimeloyl-ACP methyl ester carboxylesterase